ncbi:MAG TPA: Crp/Fnr family transcriptional regulator [Dissulfurispiraceae bacterium]|nr:Crp/Fnr family transcriptional regulator [Dissulfurispiraceae bacterium]
MKKKQQRINSAIKSIPFFTGLSTDEVEELQEMLVDKHFPRNKIIFFEEDTQNYMYVILSGRVKAVHISGDGKEHILAVHKSGDCFGEMALLDGKTAPATVTAMEDTHILILSRKVFEDYLLENNKVLRQIISVLCLRLRDSWIMLKAMSLSRSEDRIRTVLKLLAVQYGVKDGRGTIINMKLTHQNLADYASVSRETVTRFLNKLVRNGEIDILDSKNIRLTSSFL